MSYWHGGARLATVPSVWDPELVARLLGAVDRSSPKGRRDYAILLLAARLGLRLSDIRNLKLDEPVPVRWTPRSTMSVIHGRPVRSLATNREPAVGG
jgi:integrase